MAELGYVEIECGLSTVRVLSSIFESRRSCLAIVVVFVDSGKGYL